MRNITLSADQRDIDAARARARSERTTLNEAFRTWLAAYAGSRDHVDGFDRLLAEVGGKLVVGERVTRDQMNER